MRFFNRRNGQSGIELIILVAIVLLVLSFVFCNSASRVSKQLGNSTSDTTVYVIPSTRPYDANLPHSGGWAQTDSESTVKAETQTKKKRSDSSGWGSWGSSIGSDSDSYSGSSSHSDSGSWGGSHSYGGDSGGYSSHSSSSGSDAGGW